MLKRGKRAFLCCNIEKQISESPYSLSLADSFNHSQVHQNSQHVADEGGDDPYGLSEPLPIPSKPWQFISLDFSTNVLDSKGFNAILTLVDRYIKMTNFLICTKEITCKETIRSVMHEVF